MNAGGFAILVVPAIAAWAFIAWARRAAFAARLADRPNERSLHEAPRPRVGGLAVMLPALACVAAFGDEALRIVAGCAALLCAVSLADDVRSLPALPRLAAHFAAAGVAVVAIAGGAGWPLAVTAASVLAIAWMTDLFNFMDGSDGLAGGMAVIGFGAYALAAQGTASPLGISALAIASASAGFLAWNFPPARVFLGDAGSIPLGFLAGALGLDGVATGTWPAWFPAVVFAPFVIDASVTVARRLLRGERIWRAHRSHYYQRLVLAGWSHRRLALNAYGVMAAGVAVAWVAARAGPMLQCGIIAVWAAAWLLLLGTIERHLRRAGGRPPEAPGRSIG
jgi:UDP-N-acetylmuramyl pentapeptide phosphotransferase/UDP-N-acetylglucosamine-1-phosphate transferase